MCPLSASSPEIYMNDPCGIRTRVTAVKGRCLNPLTNGPYFWSLFPDSLAPQAGLEPATLRLTAGCSAIELLRISILCTFKTEHKFANHQSFYWSSPRSISIGQLNVLLRLHLQPINLVIFKGSYFRRMGNLILRAASRLDAFSVYPFHT